MPNCQAFCFDHKSCQNCHNNELWLLLFLAPWNLSLALWVGSKIYPWKIIKSGPFRQVLNIRYQWRTSILTGTLPRSKTFNVCLDVPASAPQALLLASCKLSTKASLLKFPKSLLSSVRSFLLQPQSTHWLGIEPNIARHHNFVQVYWYDLLDTLVVFCGHRQFRIQFHSNFFW